MARLLRVTTIGLVFGLLCSCGQSIPEQKVSFKNNLGIPEPKFTVDPTDFTKELKETYKADAVRLGLPFVKSTNEKMKYWLKVQLLNPSLDEDNFDTFSKAVALKTIGQISNPDDFDEIEIETQNKTGFIVTFSSSQNKRYSVDSLRQELN